VVRSKKSRNPEKTRLILEKHERAARLLANADFISWREDIQKLVEKEGLESLEPDRSNFDRTMATGILGFVKRLFGMMERQSRPEAMKKLRESLEDPDGVGRRAGKHEPAGYPGISAVGEF
jgi:hypothetical protein